MNNIFNEFDYVSDHLVDNYSFSGDKVFMVTELCFSKSKLRAENCNYVNG